jgi:hypothetical protein
MTRAKRKPSAQGLARALVSSVIALGQTKSALGELTKHMIVSVGTARDFEQCVREFLTWRIASGISIGAPVIRAELEEYLLEEGVR